LSDALAACQPTAPGGPTVNANPESNPPQASKRASGPFQGKFNRNERKGLQAEKIRIGPSLATMLCWPRASGLPKRNLEAMEYELHAG